MLPGLMRRPWIPFAPYGIAKSPFGLIATIGAPLITNGDWAISVGAAHAPVASEPATTERPPPGSYRSNTTDARPAGEATTVTVSPQASPPRLTDAPKMPVAPATLARTGPTCVGEASTQTTTARPAPSTATRGDETSPELSSVCSGPNVPSAPRSRA